MEVLDKQLQKRVRLASKRLGLQEREVINRAVSSYLGSIEDAAALNQELRIWDVLAARTMRKYKF